MAGFDRSRLESLAKEIWWNAGATIKNRDSAFQAANGKPVVWENVTNKEMWLRMAAAAALDIGVGVEEDLLKELRVTKLPR